MLGSDGYPCVAGGLFTLVGAGSDYFRDGTEPFITFFGNIFVAGNAEKGKGLKILK